MTQAATLHSAVEVLFSPEVIAERIAELCGEIAAVGLRNPLVVPILTGSFVFSADLLRGLHAAGPCRRSKGYRILGMGRLC